MLNHAIRNFKIGMSNLFRVIYGLQFVKKKGTRDEFPSLFTIFSMKNLAYKYLICLDNGVGVVLPKYHSICCKTDVLC